MTCAPLRRALPRAWAFLPCASERANVVVRCAAARR